MKVHFREGFSPNKELITLTTVANYALHKLPTFLWADYRKKLLCIENVVPRGGISSKVSVLILIQPSLLVDSCKGIS